MRKTLIILGPQPALQCIDNTKVVSDRNIPANNSNTSLLFILVLLPLNNPIKTEQYQIIPSVRRDPHASPRFDPAPGSAHIKDRRRGGRAV
jgi:hypothetical protein